MTGHTIICAIGEIDENLVLDAQEVYMKKNKKHARLVRIALIAALIILILAITAGAIYVLHDWNRVFTDKFQPTEAVKEQVDGYMDEPVASFTRNGATLSIAQTITDGNVLYAVVNLQLPEDFDMSKTIVGTEKEMPEETLKLFAEYDEATGHWYSLSTASGIWMQGEVEAEALEQMNEENMFDYISFDQFAGGSFMPRAVDVENKTFSFLLYTYLLDTTDREHFTVLFNDIHRDWYGNTPEDFFDGTVASAVENGNLEELTNEPEVLVEGPLYVTWNPTYSVEETLTQDVIKDGTVIGNLKLSPLTLEINIPNLADTYDNPLEEFDGSGPLGLDDVISMTLRLKDGTEYDISSYYGYGEDSETGEMNLFVNVNLYDAAGAFLDTSTVESVTVNDFIIQIE